MNCQDLRQFYVSRLFYSRRLLHGSVWSRRQKKTDFSAYKGLPVEHVCLTMSINSRETLFTKFTYPVCFYFKVRRTPSDHSLFSRSIFNTGRISSHNNTIFRPAACSTHKCAKPIFPCTCPVPTKNDFSNQSYF